MSPAKQDIFASLYAQWGWKTPKWDDDFPFLAVAPIDNPPRLARFFSGRESDVEKARDKLFDGNNIMVRGQWGIGKSAFILTVLQQLREFATEVRVLPLYVYDFSGNDSDSLYRHILLALAKGLLPIDKRAREIYEALTGERVGVTKSKSVKYGFNLQVFEAKGEIGESTTRALRLEHSKHYIDDLLARARRQDVRVFIGVDDLDKQPNQAAMWQMLNDAKALLRNSPCKFILTGRPIVAGYEDFSARVLELYDETFRLGPLDAATLKQAARGQLNLIRQKQREDYAPFVEETLERIALLTCGIPRVFNKICRTALEIARRNRWESISPEKFERECLPELQDEISVNIPFDVRRLLYYIYEQGGVSLVDDAQVDGMLRVMNWDTLGEAIPYLNEYVRGEWIIPIELDGRTRLTVAPLAERAAQTRKS